MGPGAFLPVHHDQQEGKIVFRMADFLPSPLSILTATLSVWIGTRALQLLGRKWPGFLLGGLIPPAA